MHARLPDAVPGSIALDIIEDDPVLLRAGRVHGEVVTRAFVVEGVEQDAELIRGDIVVTTRDARDDRVGREIVEPRTHVERVVIVGESHHRALPRRDTLIRIAHDQIRDRRREPPHRLIELAIHVHGMLQSNGADHRQRGRGRGRGEHQ